MTIIQYRKKEIEYLQKSILNLSYQISCYSPPMKPFIRFSKKVKSHIKSKNSIYYSHLFWDFDDVLQRILLNIMHKIATPDEISRLCIEQWKSNLKQLYERKEN